MTDHVLELTAVRKAFGSVVAVDDLDLAVAERELLALVGPSGCGKSTLLRLVAGLAHVDAGQIRIGGTVVDDGCRRVDPETPPHRPRVPGARPVPPPDGRRQHLVRVPRPARVPNAAGRCADWLEVIGLPGHGDRYPHELSGGERQRVALARALAPQPRLMLLDEPFASLDPNLRGRLRTEIVDVLRLTGTPALFVTHDQADALTVGDRVAVMQRRTHRAARPARRGLPPPHQPFRRRVHGRSGFLPVDDDHRTELGPLPAQQMIPPRAELVVRPDDVTIVTDPGAPGVQATVVAAEFRGPTRNYTAAAAAAARSSSARNPTTPTSTSAPTYSSPCRQESTHGDPPAQPSADTVSWR